jgi:hypothetical protein
MRPQKSVVLIALVALLLTALVAVMAQTPTQDPAKSADKKAESCCAMESCCCNSGSCDMKKEGMTASADTVKAGADMKHDCCGDSCDMKKEGMTAGTDTAKASGDMQRDCCGDSCDMANHARHDMKSAKHDMKHAADGSCCKMKSKDAKQKDATKTN